MFIAARTYLLAAAWALGACGTEPATSIGEISRPVIYGEDDRTELFENSNPKWRELGRQAVVALIDRDQWDAVQSWPSDISTVTEAVGKCASETFANQPALAFCSGVLVDFDLVLTARHCVPSPSACRQTLFVFDYSYSDPDRLVRPSPQNIYGCREIQVMGMGSEREDDFAFVRLDRPVSSERAPAALRPSGDVVPGEPIAALGFPEGTPLKIDSEGHVNRLSVDAPLLFASVDTFRGSSGSGVFDAQQRLLGIIIEGERDYVRRDGCLANRVLDETAGNEVIRRLPIEALEATGWAARTPNQSGACWSCRGHADCPDEYECIGDDTTGRWCDQKCLNTESCGTDETCDKDRCVSSETFVCIGQSVWARNRCGRSIQRHHTCGVGTYCADGQCAEQSSCANPIRIDRSQSRTSVRPVGETRFTGTCGGSGPEDVYRLDLTESVKLQAEASGYDTVLYLRTDCADAATQLVCNDDHRVVPDFGSRIERTLPPGRYFLFVDAVGPSERDYELTVNLESIAEAGSTTGSNCTCQQSNNGDWAQLLVLWVVFGLWCARSASGAGLQPKFQPMPGAGLEPACTTERSQDEVLRRFGRTESCGICCELQQTAAESITMARSRGEGTWRRRGARWQFQTFIEGRRRSFTADTKSAALQLAKEATEQAIRQPSRGGPAPKFRVLLEQYGQRATGRNGRPWAPGTANDFRKAKERLLAVCARWTGVRADKVDPHDIRELIVNNMTAASAYSSMKWLKACYADALRRSVIGSNPLDKVVGVPQPARKHESRAWTREEARAIIEQLDDRCADLLRLGLATGLRPAELMGLRVEDLQGDQLRIRRQRRPKYGDVNDALKTPKSRRTIKLSVDARAAFARLAEGGRDGWLFTEHMRGLERKIQAGANNADVRWLGLHAMRHSHASWLIADNVSVPVVSNRLGHANAAITMRLYAHAIASDDERVAGLGDL